MWKAGALLLTPSVLFVMVLLLAGGSDGATPRSDPRCDSADRAAVARLRDRLAQQDELTTRRLERSVSVLVAARSHCSYGWIEHALQDYAALERLLQQ
jgi:hypothetical protein